jgi:hypothetical protein
VKARCGHVPARAFTIFGDAAVTLSIKDLQSIMAPLTELGRGEATFEVGGLSITIRTLTPEEEIATQRYARGALTDGDSNDQINALDYLDRFRAACLGYAIVQIGDVDFRGVSTVETGEKLPNGVAVKVKKHEAIMRVMDEWSRTMVTTLFQRFTALMEKVEAGVEKTLKYDNDHIDAEIARLEEKLTELKGTKAKRDAGKEDPRGSVRDAAANKPKDTQPEAAPKETWETARSNRTSADAPVTLDAPPDIPKSVVVEDEAPAPQPKAEAAPAPQRRPVFGDRPKPREVTPSPAVEEDPLKGVMSSLADTSDPDVIEAENRRIMAERLSRKPPHIAAREVAQAVEQAGAIDGVPVFKMPVQDLNPDTAKKPVRTPPTVAKSNINPNFRPAK